MSEKQSDFIVSGENERTDELSLAICQKSAIIVDRLKNIA